MLSPDEVEELLGAARSHPRPPALDAVGVAILRHFGTTPDVSRGAVFDQQQIARAARLGLGVDGPEHVEFITGDPESEAYAEQIRQQLLAG